MKLFRARAKIVDFATGVLWHLRDVNPDHQRRRPNQRERLYPRMVEVLRLMDGDAKRLKRHPEDGMYRIGDGLSRKDTLHMRSVRRLIGLRLVVERPDGTAVLTEKGKAAVRSMSDRTVDVKRRRIIKVGIRTYERRERVEAVEYNGTNFADVAELCGEEFFAVGWNKEKRCVDAVCGGKTLEAGHIVAKVIGRDEAVIYGKSIFDNLGFQEVHGKASFAPHQ